MAAGKETTKLPLAAFTSPTVSPLLGNAGWISACQRAIMASNCVSALREYVARILGGQPFPW